MIEFVNLTTNFISTIGTAYDFPFDEASMTTQTPSFRSPTTSYKYATGIPATPTLSSGPPTYTITATASCNNSVACNSSDRTNGPERYLEPITYVARDTAMGSGIVVIAALALPIGSTVGGQLGVASAIQRMADCGEDITELPILVHPLRFSLDSDSEFGASGAAVLSNSLIIPLVIALIVRGLGTALQSIKKISRKESLTSMGWPSVLLIPFSVLAEGTAASFTRCLLSGDPLYITIGAAGVLATLGCLYKWKEILRCVIPRRCMMLRPCATIDEIPPSDATTINGVSLIRFFSRLTNPTHEWVPATNTEDRANVSQTASTAGPQSGQGRSDVGPVVTAAQFQRYCNAVGDKRWYYTEVASFTCSILVGILEGTPQPNRAFCSAKMVLVLPAVLAQCLFNLSSLVPAERSLQTFLSLTMIPQAIMSTIMVFMGISLYTDNGSMGDNLEMASASLAMTSSLIGLMMIALGLARAAIGLSRELCLRMKRRVNSLTSALSDPLLDDTELLDLQGTNQLDEPVPPAPSQPPREREEKEEDCVPEGAQRLLTIGSSYRLSRPQTVPNSTRAFDAETINSMLNLIERTVRERQYDMADDPLL